MSGFPQNLSGYQINQLYAKSRICKIPKQVRNDNWNCHPELGSGSVKWEKLTFLADMIATLRFATEAAESEGRAAVHAHADITAQSVKFQDRAAAIECSSGVPFVKQVRNDKPILFYKITVLIFGALFLLKNQKDFCSPLGWFS